MKFSFAIPKITLNMHLTYMECGRVVTGAEPRVGARAAQSFRPTCNKGVRAVLDHFKKHLFLLFF